MAGTVNLGHLEAMLGVNTTQLTRDMNRARAIMTKGAQQMQAIGKSMTLGLSLPLAILGGLAVNTFAKFEKSMNQVRAVSGATGKEFQALTSIARKLGSSTYGWLS